jgi:hypothetical protein
MTYATIHLARFIIITLILFVSFVAFVSPSHAYFTTKQETIALPSHSGLFLIDYDFGVKKSDVRLPVSAVHTSSSSRNAVSYTILDQNNTAVEGTVAGFVYSKAKLQKNGMYFIPKNQAQRLTLAVVFTPKVVDANKQYRLQVNYLPFTFNGTQELQLNPSELKYYTTKLISL